MILEEVAGRMALLVLERFALQNSCVYFLIYFKSLTEPCQQNFNFKCWRSGFFFFQSSGYQNVLNTQSILTFLFLVFTSNIRWTPQGWFFLQHSPIKWLFLEQMVCYRLFDETWLYDYHPEGTVWHCGSPQAKENQDKKKSTR